MAWTWSAKIAAYIPVAFVRSGPGRFGSPPSEAEEEFNLIEVFALTGGCWKAVCECGDAPKVFAEEPAAWEWITIHHCPVLETDTRPVHP